MDRKVYFVGGGIGSMAAAFFLIRDGGFTGDQIVIFEQLMVSGGSMDGCGDVEHGFICRGGRMLNAPTYECLQEMLKDIPSIREPGKSVFKEIRDFDAAHPTHANSRLVDARGQRWDVETMGFNHQDRMELLALCFASEKELDNTRINEWFSPRFFETQFWYMWQTTFAFQPWSSATELNRYMHRFMHEFIRIQTLEGVMRTPMNQYDSIIKPLQKWLIDHGVKPRFGCTAVDVVIEEASGKFTARKLVYKEGNAEKSVEIRPQDLCFVQNGSMTDSSSVGTWKTPATLAQSKDAPSFAVWQKIADRHPGKFGCPEKFYKHVNESMWQSFTVTTKNKQLFEMFTSFQRNVPGSGALMTFKDSNWLMSIVIPFQPHFAGQPEGVYVFWGYGLYPNRIGNFVHKSMLDCTGEDIFHELCQHCRVSQEYVKDVNCLPCIMPQIVSMFQPRQLTDRPLPVPKGATNFGFISQFVEIPHDVVFTVEYSVRAAQMAVYQLMNIKKDIPRVSRYDLTPSVNLKAVKKAYKGAQPVEARRKKHGICCKLAILALAGVGAAVAFALK